ncbi:hypothetical protein D3OALGB2SA_961 [Olavius algarvensis associated proteobacterium Delta 3]|nr:hypothetical protein D3OALGB2SA_961 [Olavius algarvensis associated proteobacterium Delta 3]
MDTDAGSKIQDTAIIEELEWRVMLDFWVADYGCMIQVSEYMENIDA